jgi:ring-1,2-phenylacetyl-CoA epoxidase subunit PaaC
MKTTAQLLEYILRIADNALVNSHRLSQWCGHGPILEQDIAMTNIALDHIGQARSLYQYAADIYNAMNSEDKSNVFASAPLQTMIENGTAVDEDDLAFLRDAWDFKNVLLVEQPNQDWAYTIARSFYFDAYNKLFYTALLKSTDATLAAIAEKSLKEVSYHNKWSSEWVIRLGDGTEESASRMQKALNEYWEYTGEMFTMDELATTMLEAGIGVDYDNIHTQWLTYVGNILDEARLKMPTQTWMQQGGKTGTHTEHLGYILSDLQFMQRAYPGMKW